MVTRKMDVKNKKLIFIVLMISLYGILTLKKFQELKAERSKTISAWIETISKAQDISNILANFIYLGKSLTPERNTLLTQIARLRLELNDEMIKQKQRPNWDSSIPRIVQSMNELQNLLNGYLPDSPHKNALSDQYLIRKNAFEKSMQFSKKKIDQYLKFKNSPTSRILLFWYSE